MHFNIVFNFLSSKNILVYSVHRTTARLKFFFNILSTGKSRGLNFSGCVFAECIFIDILKFKYEHVLLFGILPWRIAMKDWYRHICTIGFHESLISTSKRNNFNQISRIRATNIHVAVSQFLNHVRFFMLHWSLPITSLTRCLIIIFKVWPPLLRII